MILLSIGNLFSNSNEKIIKKYRFNLSPEYFYYDGGTTNFEYKAYKADNTYGGWDVEFDDILLIYDSSNGKSKTGFFITEDAIYYKSKKSLFAKRAEGRIALEDLKTFSFDCSSNDRASCYAIYLNDIKIKMMTPHKKKDDEMLKEIFTDIIAHNNRKMKNWERGDIRKLASKCVENKIADQQTCACVSKKLYKEFDNLEDVYSDPMDILIMMEIASVECEAKKNRSKRSPKTKINSDEVYDIADAGSIVLGSPNAFVTIIQWMDFQ